MTSASVARYVKPATHIMVENPFLFPPVAQEESGQKLLQFLERRLELPSNLIHRWIRTGQIRLNGKRCKPFARLAEGDIVRLPPFAETLSGQAREDKQENICKPNSTLPLPPIVADNAGLLVLNKPAGLPVQPGTGHCDSVCSRLNSHYANNLFKPVPCHRLDRDTSGILLVATEFNILREIQDNFHTGKIHKEYLVWVAGEWQWDKDVLLHHYLRKEGDPGMVRMKPVKPRTPFAKECFCIVSLLRKDKGKSLLHARLLTGRTHQIRAQLACVGYPVIGDGKYGTPGAMRLHALRVSLPNGIEFSCLPDWDSSLLPTTFPPPLYPDKEKADLLTLPHIS